MAFTAAKQIFDSVDEVAVGFVADNLSNIITMVTPWVALGLVIALMAEGLSVMASPGGDPLSSLFKKFLRYAIIISIASAGGIYQTDLADAALKMPNEISQAITFGSATSGGTDTANIIDKTLVDGMTAGKRAFENGSFWRSDGIGNYILGAGIMLITILITALGAGLILMAKFMLAITVCFGPIFIFALCFKSTEALFSKWVGSLINYILVTVLLTLVFGFVMELISNTIAAAAKADSNANLLPIVVGGSLMTIASWFILKAVPGIASSWGSGVQAIAHDFGGTAKRAAGGAKKAGAGIGGAGKGAATGAAAGASKGMAAGAAGGPVGMAAGAALGGTAGAAGGAAGGAMRGLARGSRR